MVYSSTLIRCTMIETIFLLENKQKQQQKWRAEARIINPPKALLPKKGLYSSNNLVYKNNTFQRLAFSMSHILKVTI